MRIRSSLLLLYAGSVTLGSRIFLPELTGPHKIGLTHLELIDESRADPFAPKRESASPPPRDLMITLFYPATTTTPSTTPTNSAVAAPNEETSSSFAPQFPGPATSSYIDSLLGLPNGTAARLTTRAYLDAPISYPEDKSIILFSPGFGFTRGLYTALLSDLASRGWIVVSVDHPHDAGIVEYPDGRAVRARPDWSWPLLEPPGLRERVLDTRVADLLFVLEALQGNASSVVTAGLPGMRTAGDMERRRGLNTTHVGALGHSFGGAAAVQSLLNSTAVAAAADLDGFLYGPVVKHGTQKPALVLGFPEHFATDDPDAAPGWPSLQGWKADFTVEGTVHESFSDCPVLAEVLGLGADSLDGFGKVRGKRMVNIMSTYVRTFFEMFVLGVDDGDGSRGLLEGDSSTFPEVKLRRKGVHAPKAQPDQIFGMRHEL